MTSPCKVAVTILTFRRPNDIAQIVPAVLDQVRSVNADPETPYAVSIVVIDNDPAGSARTAVEGFDAAEVSYVVESAPGIAAARNRGLAEAAAADLLIFIDDDERPHDGWLATLLAARRDFDAAVVAGAVVSDFDAPVDPWLTAGGFFQRRRLPTGTVIEVAATNNLLLDLAVVRQLDLRFDDRFGLTGGEDSLFTRTIAASGARMVWCNEAVVTDSVPVSRMGRRWVLIRAMSYGSTSSRVAVRLASPGPDRLKVRLTAIGRGIPRVVLGLGRALVGTALRSATHQARGLRTAARGAGMVGGAFGYSYRQYQR